MQSAYKKFVREFIISKAGRIFMALLLGAALGRTQSSNAPAPAQNYSTFSKFITDLNIFNPNRYAHSPNRPYTPVTRAVRHNSFGLAGTMSYDEGETPGLHAFFDGTSADYRKALQPGATIAVFKVTAITPDSVTLVSKTNSVVLKIGEQMRDDGQGNWTLSATPVSYTAASLVRSSRNGRHGFRGQRTEGGGELTSDNSDTNAVEELPDNMADQGEPPPDAAEGSSTDNVPADAVALPSGPGSDALRRLMELRAQEEQSGNRN